MIASAYPFVVFTHVLGAVGLFAALAIDAVAIARLRRTEVAADARTWTGVLALPARLGPVAMLTTLASGIWMMAVNWGYQPWIAAAFLALVAMGASGSVSARRTKRVRAVLAAHTGAELPAPIRSLVSGRALPAAMRLRLALGVGIIGLMTMKPGAIGSSLIVALAAAAGVIAGVRPIAARAAPRSAAATAA